jgi:hypothetical protein
MSAATASFLSYWSQFPLKSAPFVHPGDAGSRYLKDFELSLLPIPFVGNLSEAEAIILMLNPGLDTEDIAWEQNPHFHSALVRNLSQSFPAGSFPQFYLDPAFEMHPGAGYWAKSRKIPGKRDLQKLRSVIQALALRDGVSLAAAQAHVARKIAVIQLAPYHSAKLTRRDALTELPSACQARAFVEGVVREKSKLVIAARSVSKWGFTDPLNTGRLVVYKSTHGASASLTTTSEGGRALLAQLSSAAADA